jgi:hypothetical protein
VQQIAIVTLVGLISTFTLVPKSDARVLSMSDRWAAEELPATDLTRCILYSFPVAGRSFRLVSEQRGGELQIRLGAPLPRGITNFEVDVGFDRHAPFRERAEALPNTSGSFDIGMNFRGLGGFEAALRSSSTLRLSLPGPRGRGDLVSFPLAGIAPALRAYLDCKERHSHM